MVAAWFWRRLLSELREIAPATVDGAAQECVERALRAAAQEVAVSAAAGRMLGVNRPATLDAKRETVQATVDLPEPQHLLIDALMAAADAYQRVSADQQTLAGRVATMAFLLKELDECGFVLIRDPRKMSEQYASGRG